MLTVGIDAGVENVKVVVMQDSTCSGYANVWAGRGSAEEVAENGLHMALARAGVSREAVRAIGVTGMGRGYVPFAEVKLADPLCLAAGIHQVAPGTRTVIDIGAQKVIAVRCEGGQALDLAQSDRCAAGAGRYLEVLSQILGVEVEKLDALAAKSRGVVRIEASCAVFAEAEILSHIHSAKNPPEEIILGVLRGLVRRMIPLLYRVQVRQPVAAVGGVARCAELIKSMEALIGCPVLVPKEPEQVSALGAALLTQSQLRGTL